MTGRVGSEDDLGPHMRGVEPRTSLPVSEPNPLEMGGKDTFDARARV